MSPKYFHNSKAVFFVALFLFTPRLVTASVSPYRGVWKGPYSTTIGTAQTTAGKITRVFDQNGEQVGSFSSGVGEAICDAPNPHDHSTAGSIDSDGIFLESGLAGCSGLPVEYGGVFRVTSLTTSADGYWTLFGTNNKESHGIWSAKRISSHPLNASELGSYPYTSVGTPRTDSPRGSGVVVERRVVLTAAHVLTENSGTTFTQKPIYFDPAVGSRSDSAILTLLPTLPNDKFQYIETVNATTYGSFESADVDFAAVVFAQDLNSRDVAYWQQNALGTIGYREILGYPNMSRFTGINESSKLHSTGKQNGAVFARVGGTHRLLSTEDLVTDSGNSGGPIFSNDGISPSVVGILVQRDVQPPYASYGLEIDSSVASYIKAADVYSSRPLEFQAAVIGSTLQLSWNYHNFYPDAFVFEVRIGDSDYVDFLVVQSSERTAVATGLEENTEYSFRLRARIYDSIYSDYSNEITVKKGNQLEEWRRQNFGTTSNSGNAADSATPHNDGITNIEKYAFGIYPQMPYSGNKNSSSPVGRLPEGIVNQSNNGNSVSLSFVRRKSATSPGVKYIPEFSSDLRSWNKVGSAHRTESIDAVWELVTWTSESPDPESEEYFGRLRLESE